MDMLEKLKMTQFFQSYGLNDDAIDVTTGLIAKKYIMNFITYLVNRDHPFTLCILDIDNFKSINDTYGHLVGDEVLARSAKVICDTIGDVSYIGRYGGDEFIIVIPDMVDYDEKWALLKKLHISLRQEMILESGTKISITATTGAASYPDDEQNVDNLFKKADAMLYRGKQKGRDRFIIFVYEIHKDMVFDIKKSLPDNMMKIRSLFNGKKDLEYEIYEALSIITQIIGVDGCGLFISDQEPRIYSNGGSKYNLKALPRTQVEMRLKNHRVTVNNRSELEGDKKFQDYLAKDNLRSCVIIELESKRNYLGYLIIFSEHNRVWQDSEIALAYYLSAMISDNIYYKKKMELPNED